MPSQTDDQRAVAVANRLADTLTPRELVALSWLAIEQDNETSADRLRVYEVIRRRRGWKELS
jgi:hypothetical protein